MSIHREHPFVPVEGERNPVRRLRGRMSAPVTVWTADFGRARAGWTVSSLLVADGRPPMLAGLVDADSDLASRAFDTGRVVVNLLGPQHRALPDAFAGLAPAPGGVFTLGVWDDTAWGPALTDAAGWAGVRLDGEPASHLGFALLLRGVIEHVHLADDPASLAHVRGRYLPAG